MDEGEFDTEAKIHTTANIDQVADQRIQTIIRQEFAHSTLLCIAHRLRTIIDYDRVIVLGDNGRLVEFDTPSNLLRRKGSIFRQLCESEGDSEAIVEFIRLKTFDSTCINDIKVEFGMPRRRIKITIMHVMKGYHHLIFYGERWNNRFNISTKSFVPQDC
ncbi:hypothetical protein BC936DRAFT_147231 [Jimgerdemannia flammicorona]|uniref:P-loop containing nucleoside triphosphate hydrolase protein n=1 Tax=Jimgerdemannia flammicorona TaxID=994334 RepID=A0A433D5W9_9FUNG|nr:hypothetical protein BC936DRAFT_147231 [Jimgerdemannia flammicorona]